MTIEKQIIELTKKVDLILSILNEKSLSSDTSNSKWINEAEVMRMLNLSKKSLQILRKNEVLRYSTASGRNIKYFRKDVEDYINKNSNIRH